MNGKKILWNMFGKVKRRKSSMEFIDKEVKMGTTDNMDVLSKLWEVDPRSGASAAMQREMEELKQQAQYQKYAQLQQYTQQANSLGAAYGSMGVTTSTATTSSIPSVWSTGSLGNQLSPTPMPTHDAQSEFHQLVLLQVINLITNVGPSMAKKLIRRFDIKLTSGEVDKIYEDMNKTMSSDDDPELDKVINDVAKEVKL